MSIINVPPTKTKQLEMKRDLATAMEGYTLLEQKREILVMELMHLLDRVKLVQREVDERRARAYATLRRAMSYNGYHLMRRVAEGIEYEHHVEAHVRIAAGVRIPSLETHHGSFSSQYGLIGTDSLVDQTMADYLALLEALGHLAELSPPSGCWRANSRRHSGTSMPSSISSSPTTATPCASSDRPSKARNSSPSIP